MVAGGRDSPSGCSRETIGTLLFPARRRSFGVARQPGRRRWARSAVMVPDRAPSVPRVRAPFAELLREARAALETHPLRSGLSIAASSGVAAIVSSVAIVDGGRRRAIDSVASLGDRNIIVRSRARTTPGRSGAEAPALRLTHARALRERLTSVRAVAALRTAQLEIAAATAHAKRHRRRRDARMAPRRRRANRSRSLADRC